MYARDVPAAPRSSVSSAHRVQRAPNQRYPNSRLGAYLAQASLSRQNSSCSEEIIAQRLHDFHQNHSSELSSRDGWEVGTADRLGLGCGLAVGTLLAQSSTVRRINCTRGPPETNSEVEGDWESGRAWAHTRVSRSSLGVQTYSVSQNQGDSNSPNSKNAGRLSRPGFGFGVGGRIISLGSGMNRLVTASGHHISNIMRQQFKMNEVDMGSLDVEKRKEDANANGRATPIQVNHVRDSLIRLTATSRRKLPKTACISDGVQHSDIEWQNAEDPYGGLLDRKMAGVLEKQAYSKFASMLECNLPTSSHGAKSRATLGAGDIAKSRAISGVDDSAARGSARQGVGGELMTWLADVRERPSVNFKDSTPQIEQICGLSDQSEAESQQATAMVKMAQHELSRLKDPEWLGKAKVVYDRKSFIGRRDERYGGTGAGAQNLECTEGRGQILSFSADFEGGNLHKVTKVGRSEYDILLSPDTGTSRHMQWFYFRVANVQKGLSYKINLVNMCKKQSLYNRGLRPLTYSEQRVARTGVGWSRACEDIVYFKSALYYRQQSRIPFRTLTFTYTGEFDDDIVYFAHCYPYGMHELKKEISQILSDKTRQHVMTNSSLCRTLGGNECMLLKVTQPTECTEKLLSREGVLISARCHPGETPASLMMQGIIRFLTSCDPKAVALRNAYVFYLVPMLNPDGVVSGNTRSTLEGSDLNRKWQEPDCEEKRRDLKVLTSLKKLMARITRERKVALVLDLHAHSRRFNVFAYGCRPAKGTELVHRQPRGFERVFPKLLSQACSAFSYAGSSYRLRKSKEGTARAVFHREFGVRGVYTIEASFLGGDFGKFNGRHYTSADYEKIGIDICHAMLDFSDVKKVKATLETLGCETECEDDSELSSDSDFVSEGESEDEAFPPSPMEQPIEVVTEIKGSRIPQRKVQSATVIEPTNSRPRKSKKSKAKPDEVLNRQKTCGAKKVSPATLFTDRPATRPSVLRSPVKELTSKIEEVFEDENENEEVIEVEKEMEEDTHTELSRSTSAPAMSPLPRDFQVPGVSMSSNVLDRIHSMRQQWGGIHQELGDLQGRIASYDGYTQKVFEIPQVDGISIQSAGAITENRLKP